MHDAFRTPTKSIAHRVRAGWLDPGGPQDGAQCAWRCPVRLYEGMRNQARTCLPPASDLPSAFPPICKDLP